MTVADYVVSKLIEYGVTDVFGIPGGVILRLLCAMHDKQPILTPHLTCHEQTAGFAACGYAQASGKLGVAYATRGPGFTNLVTSIAEAYQESLPVLFITAHGVRPDRGLRFENNQELDAVSMVSSITKYAENVDSIEEVTTILNEACNLAISGRKGPVFLDFNSSLWMKEIDEDQSMAIVRSVSQGNSIDDAIDCIIESLNEAKHPIVLIGDGLRHSISREKLLNIAKKLKIPILSSRGAQDLLSESPYYYGYIGSHGIRYANFILSKADLIIAVGNRLAFPISSESFTPIVRNARIIRIDIDDKEFIRKIPGAINFCTDAGILLDKLAKCDIKGFNIHEWIEICGKIKTELDCCDITEPVERLTEYLKADKSVDTYVCDIGNNEFWFARAFEKCRKAGTLLCSKSFGTLGAGIGRTIGVFYALKKPVCCVIGDQGFQYNTQELAFIKQRNLPIKIIVLNNHISGMITDHERNLYNDKLFHVNKTNGYWAPDFEKIVKGYGLNFIKSIKDIETEVPLVFEINVSANVGLTPNLPKGRACYDMEPRLEKNIYDILNQI